MQETSTKCSSSALSTVRYHTQQQQQQQQTIDTQFLNLKKPP